MERISVRSRSREELIEITAEVRRYLVGRGSGICVIYTPHTTAAITINENADPDVAHDMILGLDALALERCRFLHGEGNSPAHIKSSLVGCSETIIVQDGEPVLGTWQGIWFCEFDGPRSRQVFFRFIPG
jgi:secondary thiamine-phosphate synthase enzyme